jgi:hypothetical protein
VSPNTCGTTENDGNDNENENESSAIVPTISAPNKVSIHAGETLHVAFTASDCADRPIRIVAATTLPKGAVIVNSFDTELHKAKAVVTWVVPTNTRAQTLAITLKAAVTESSNHTIFSAPQSVSVKVLAPVQSSIPVSGSIVVSNTITSARFNAKTHKLEVSGQVLWAANSTSVQRQAILRAESALVDNAANHAYLGTASVALNGTWAASIAVNASSAPCSVDVTFNGKTGVKAVAGVRSCDN